MTLFVDMYGIFSDDYKHIVRIHWKPWKGSFRFAPPPRGPTYALYKKKKMKTFCFGLRRILHSESDFTICWSSRHTSPCEGLMKRQACFRFHQNAQHALWCGGVELLYILRGTCEAQARAAFHASRPGSLERPAWMRALTPHLPARPHFCRFAASHESDFCTSGSLNTFYFGWVWKINGALGRLLEECLVSLISRSSNSLKYRVMLNPELQSEDSQKML